MKTDKPESWHRMRAAYRPDVPDLDVDAILTAVRREAAAHPLRRPAPGLAAAIPTWACAAAAALAILASATVVVRSVGVADTHITQAWLHSLQPDEFEPALLGSGEPRL